MPPVVKEHGDGSHEGERTVSKNNKHRRHMLY